jgi:hypothetical protein
LTRVYYGSKEQETLVKEPIMKKLILIAAMFTATFAFSQGTFPPKCPRPEGIFVQNEAFIPPGLYAATAENKFLPVVTLAWVI